jgi:hypothetical protein
MSANSSTLPNGVMAGAVGAAHTEHATSHVPKPRLLIDSNNPDQTVEALRNILSEASVLYDRGVPVRLISEAPQHGVVAHEMTPDDMIRLTHTICRPYRRKAKAADGTIIESDVPLPRNVATMYLGWRGAGNFRHLTASRQRRSCKTTAP